MRDGSELNNIKVEIKKKLSMRLSTVLWWMFTVVLIEINAFLQIVSS